MQAVALLLSAAALAAPQPVPTDGAAIANMVALTDMSAAVSQAISTGDIAEAPATSPAEPPEDHDDGAQLKLRGLKVKMKVPI